MNQRTLSGFGLSIKLRLDINRYRQPNSLTTKLLQLQLIKLTYLTNFFLSIFIASDTTQLRTEAYTLLEDVIGDLICQESDVLKYVLSLNTNKACSPDGITARLFCEPSSPFVPSITRVFNCSLALGKLPCKCFASLQEG